jgi:hypothetical protein
MMTIAQRACCECLGVFLAEPSRIEVVNSVCDDDGRLDSTAKIGPSAAQHGSVHRILSKRNDRAVGLICSWLEMASSSLKVGTERRALVIASSSLEDGTERTALAIGKKFRAGPMKLVRMVCRYQVAGV